MQCPSLETLTDYLRGLVVGNDRALLQEHLATGCPMCQQNQRWLREIQRIAPLDDSFAFPEAITAQIVAWMPMKPARTPLRTLIAQLLFDSFAPLPLAEARKVVVSETISDATAAQQLLYHVEGYDVDLRLEKVAEAYELLGQVLAADQSELAGLTVRLSGDDTTLRTTTTDAESMFRFTDLTPQAYQLRIELGANVIEVPDIRVG
jgi:hypothetical protein